ncbi:hypothetical protein QAD02_020978 [Eretmocerus hayati]|uniref:Uncharacterized protein n=1 Tax=Eretmocerus hayati TaxID=131215 RepID=A0ACC2PTS0_9HYME|nr:hypothetical protein QAD02_020978 [Eretmocerus hayati]
MSQNDNNRKVKRLHNGYVQKQWKRKVDQQYASYLNGVYARVYGKTEGQAVSSRQCHENILDEDGANEIGEDEDADEGSSELIPACKVTRSLKKILVPWAIESNIPHCASSELLHGIRSEMPETCLPLDPRTLLKTKSNTPVEELAGGYYCHFGFAQCIQKIIRERKARGITNYRIEALINIDGAPLGASSEKNLWPILCSDRLVEDVFIIGVYAGESKPTDSNEFLKRFVDEAVDLINNGFHIDGDEADYGVVIYALVCDTPTKAFILKVKPHMGYFSCTKCEIEGEHIDSVCFPGQAAAPRTDEKFRENTYTDDYQQGETELNRIPKLGLVSGVVLDAMHLVFIGVMKKILLIIMFVTSIYKLPSRTITAISEWLKKIREYIPSEFARKVRALKHVKFYKATELRQFLLYSGIVALRGLVHPDVYVNYLTLHVAISMLSHPHLSKDETYLDYTKKLLQRFVSHFENLYGAKYVPFNVHGLLHLVNDVRKYGHLENFSAFRFENFIGKLKKLIRKGNQPLQQIIRRSAEIESLKEENSSKNIGDKIILNTVHHEGPAVRDFPGATQSKRAELKTFSINCASDRDNCLLIDGERVVGAINNIQTLQKDIYIVGRELAITGEFYDCPCPSSILNIHLVDGPAENIAY